MGFVGLNETGKTNLLDAIRMLDWNFQPTAKDRSKLNNGLPCLIWGQEYPAATDTLEGAVRAVLWLKKAEAESAEITIGGTYNVKNDLFNVEYLLTPDYEGLVHCNRALRTVDHQT